MPSCKTCEAVKAGQVELAKVQGICAMRPNEHVVDDEGRTVQAFWPHSLTEEQAQAASALMAAERA